MVLAECFRKLIQAFISLQFLLQLSLVQMLVPLQVSVQEVDVGGGLHCPILVIGGIDLFDNLGPRSLGTVHGGLYRHPVQLAHLLDLVFPLFEFHLLLEMLHFLVFIGLFTYNFIILLLEGLQRLAILMVLFIMSLFDSLLLVIFVLFTNFLPI
jgi:hypothetical protein